MELLITEEEAQLVSRGSDISDVSSNASKGSKHSTATVPMVSDGVPPVSLTPSADESRSRKTSVISQSNLSTSSPKRGEVYV